jgi:hypothetical protein
VLGRTAAAGEACSHCDNLPACAAADDAGEPRAMAAFVVPMHTDDLELVKPDRFCVRRVQDVEAAGTDIMTDIDGEHNGSIAVF